MVVESQSVFLALQSTLLFFWKEKHSIERQSKLRFLSLLRKKISFYLLFKDVAVKLEFQEARHPQLLYESKLYMTLHGGIGNPHIQGCGQEKIYNVLVMDFSGRAGQISSVSV